MLPGQPLHPLKHALQIFTDTSKEGWGAHLNERTARGTWSLPESKLHINHLELKAVFLALKEFQDLCCNNIVLVDTDNTTVAAYINKERGMKSGSLCALLWRILSWCTRKQVTLRARHIPGRLNVIADKLSRLGQTIQTEWFLHPEVFQAICTCTFFQDRKLQPGTIDGYRSAIADKLGNSPINVSRDENLTRLLDSFHRDRPKGRRGIPFWNLSLVLHQLTKAPFEPLKEASLKHLTFNTVFLLALGSGKCRSEIHAWLHKNIRHQSD